jgi:hypothetical protein
MSLLQLRLSRALWERRAKWRARRLAAVRKAAHANDAQHPLTVSEVAHINKWKTLLAEAERMTRRRSQQIADLLPLRDRAYKVAAGLVGIMEQGGNNAGPMVAKIITANGGTGPEPWCGDFVAYCYRLAGSKSVTRAWASVRLLGGLAGVKRTSSPRRGDLVRFTFDHVGIYDHDNGDGTITTIEGNTGAVGAVSDSSTGGDGVYRKRRSKTLVNDYLRVSR